MCTSVDGYVTTQDGRPAPLADPSWDPAAFGFGAFPASCDAVLKLGLIVLPLLLGGGTQLTPFVGADAMLTLESERVLPTGAVELVYACG